MSISVSHSCEFGESDVHVSNLYTALVEREQISVSITHVFNEEEKITAYVLLLLLRKFRSFVERVSCRGYFFFLF